MSSHIMEKTDPNVEEKLATPSDEKIEAAPFALEQSLVEIDPLLDRRITRKLDRHLLPWLFGIWFFAFIDRSNIGNAKITGLTTDLGLDGVKFNVALSVFYMLDLSILIGTMLTLIACISWLIFQVILLSNVWELVITFPC